MTGARSANSKIATKEPREHKESGSPSQSKRQKLNAIGKVVRHAHFGDEFEIADTATDSHVELVGVHYTRKGNAHALPPRRLRQQVLVLTEEHTSE